MKHLAGGQLIAKVGIDYFKDASTFGALSDEAIIYLLENGEVRQLDKGDILFAYGDPGDSFFVNLKGKIEFFKTRQNEATHIRDYLFGQEVGSVAMIGLHPRVGDARAAEDSIMLEVSCGLFHDLHENYPVDFGILLLNLSREMARHLRASDDKLAEHHINL
jgi:CRP-like cAMP-binding protein